MSKNLHIPSGRRMIRAHVANFYDGTTPLEQSLRDLTALQEFAEKEGELDIASACELLHGQLEEGLFPAVVFPGSDLEPLNPPEPQASEAAEKKATADEKKAAADQKKAVKTKKAKAGKK